MIRFSIWISFAAWIANFDNGYSGAVLIMPAFRKAFGTCHEVQNLATGAVIQECNITAIQQSLISLSYLCLSIGACLSGIAGRYMGRRWSIQVGSAMAIIGAAGMLGTAGSFRNYMVCKCISATGIGQLISTSVTYGSECIAAQRRGLGLGIYNIGLAMGNFASFAVCIGSAKLAPDNNWQWKTPIICQIPLGILLGAGILMFPESPRWLLNKNREEEARRSFGILYQRDPYSPEVTAQVNDVKSHIESERGPGTAIESWLAIYRPKYIRRTAASALIMIGIGITGIQFVQPYATIFLRGVGISNPYLINVIIGLCILGGACVGPFVVEYGGRRFALLYGFGTMGVCMLVLSSVSTALGMADMVARMVVVVFLCLWAFIFGGTVAPSASLAAVEMHSVSLRTYGQANSMMLFGIFSFAATFWTPYMLGPKYGNMGPNVGYFYAGVTMVVVTLVYLLVPETACLTLEQIDDSFNSGIKAWKTSTAQNKRLNRTGRKAQESVTEEGVGQKPEDEKAADLW